jgi:hypothetical protein
VLQIGGNLILGSGDLSRFGTQLEATIPISGADYHTVIEEVNRKMPDL